MGTTLSSLKKPTEERAIRVPGAWAEDSQDGVQGDSNQPKMKYCSKGGTEFPEFRRLPPELRLKIWKYALPGPRNIDIDFKFRYTGVRHTTGNEMSLSTGSTFTDELEPTNTPSCMQGIPTPGSEKYNTYLGSKGRKCIPINLAEDTIVSMGFSRFNIDDEIFASSGLKNVKRLAIDVPTWRRFRSVYWKDLQCLEHVTILLPCYRHDLHQTEWDRYRAMAGINFVGQPDNDKAREHITGVAKYTKRNYPEWQTPEIKFKYMFWDGHMSSLY